MSKVILHIGSHKTGTTALQRFLGDNAKAVAKQGIAFKRLMKYEGFPRTRNAHFLYRYVKITTDPETSNPEYRRITEKNIAAFRTLAKQHDTLLLTEERLWYQGAIRPQSWQLIKELFDDAGVTDVEIIVYLRRQDQFIASLWSQWVKGRTRLRATLTEFATHKESAAIMDYWKGLQAIDEAFGEENVTVRVYERSQLREGDIRQDFCSLIGVDPTGFTYRDSETNPSLNANIVEMKRVANCLPEYRATDNFLRRPAIAASRASGVKAAPSTLPPEVSEQLMAPYLEGNERIARERLGREDGMLFAPVTDRSKDVQTSDFGEDAIRLFTAVLSQEHERLLEAEERIAELEKQLGRRKTGNCLLQRVRTRLTRLVKKG